MSRKNRGDSENRGKQGFAKGFVLYAGLIAYMISLLMRLVISLQLGDGVLGMFAPAYELYGILGILGSYGIARTMTGMLRSRLKREQYRSARKVFRVAFRMALLLGIVLGVLVALLAGVLGSAFMLEPMTKRAIFALAPSVFLAALITVFRGYVNAGEYAVTGAISRYLEQILMLFCAWGLGQAFYTYGCKAAALLQNDAVAASYGAFGASLGIMLAELVTLIYLLIVYAFYSGSMRRMIRLETGRRKESSGGIAGGILSTGIPLAFVCVCIDIFLFLDQRFFNAAAVAQDLSADMAARWGEYYGRLAVIVGLGAVLACCVAEPYLSRIGLACDRGEQHVLRERIGMAAKGVFLFSVPLAIYLAVLATPLTSIFYGGTNDEAAMLLRIGAAIVFLAGAAYLSGQVLARAHRHLELVLGAVGALIVHILLVWILVGRKQMGLQGVTISLLVSFIIPAIVYSVLMAWRTDYRPDWLYDIAFPLVSACVSGLLVLLFCKLLLAAVGNLGTILISAIIGIVVYMILLMLLHAVNESDLERMPFGRMWMALGRLIRIM